MKVCAICGQEISTRDGENRCPSGCRDPDTKAKIPLKQRKKRQKEMDDVMSSLGLVKVRGALCGTYWE